VAERLLSCIRGGDTACRYGGDEFVLLRPDIDDEKHASDVAQKIHARRARSYRVDDCSVAVTASIGWFGPRNLLAPSAFPAGSRRSEARRLPYIFARRIR
jgi:diguanylate cyclase (GGDEF)-like protein